MMKRLNGKNMTGKRLRSGFTLVELSLSLVFISTLSLTVVLVIAGAISSYHKSLTINQVDTVGANLVDDMRFAIQKSSPAKLENMCFKVYGSSGNKECEQDGAKRFVSVARTGSVTHNGKTFEAPVFGALCTGTYSYIWNSGYYFNPSEYSVSVGKASLKYDTSKPTATDFKLLKIEDKERAVCIAAVRRQNNNTTGSNYNNQDVLPEINTTIDGLMQDGEKVLLKEDPEELLSGGSDGMALYSMDVSIAEQSGVPKNIYYYTTFILGTVQGGINVDATGESCEVPEGYNGLVEDFDYCAINKFNFAALANGEK